MDERRIGLGIIGLADALIKMEIRYGSPQSLQVIEKIFKTLRDTAYQYSVELAQEKGAFPKFEADKYLQSGFMQTMPESIRSNIKQYGIRNALLITMAPTGKISLLAGVNSGIEPVFSFSYQQKDRLGVRTMYHPLYQQYIEDHGTDDIPDYFVVADDLTPVEHVQVQGLIQKYVDSAISKTVNAPETHSIQDVKDLYTQAYKLGCKGISYMREGSREGTLIRADKDKKEEKAVETDKPVKEISHNWERPMIIAGSTYKMKTPVGTAFITVNRDEYGSPIETFINIGRAGSDVQAMAEAMGRVISKFLKQSSTASSTERAMIIIDQLRGIGGTRSVGFGPNRVMSLPDAVAKAMAMDMGLIGSGNQPADMPQAHGKSNGHSNHQIQLALNGSESVGLPLTQQLDEHMPSADICSECGIAGLVHEEGCAKCYSCGHSQC